ncbi:MAG: response regulator, partial [Halomonas sp.]
MYSLLVADDHPLFRDALLAVVSAGLADTQLLEVDSLAAALQCVENNDGLDLLLLDLSLPDTEGLEGLKILRDTCPWLPVAIVSALQERQLVLDAIALGAVGYIPKSTPREQLLAAI